MKNLIRLVFVLTALNFPGLSLGDSSTGCKFSNLELPPDFAVFAAGDYSGRKLDVQIDQSGHQATQMDVVVHYREKPVVLILGAYEPTIWNVQWTEGTRIIAVLAGGYHRQAVAGINKTTPLLVTTYEDKSKCGYFYISRKELKDLNPLSRRFFGRPVDTVYLAKNGKIAIGGPLPEGEKLVSSTDTPPDSFVDKTAPPAGRMGIQEALRKGLLRKATDQDMQAWMQAVSAARPKEDIPPLVDPNDRPVRHPSPANTFVVLGPFTIPAGLYGANAVSFIIPEGVPYPQGNPGHSTIYDFNTIRCAGVACGERGESKPKQPVGLSKRPIVSAEKADAPPVDQCSSAQALESERSCLKTELERTDREINRIYQDLLSGLDPPEKEKLRSQQRAWLKSRNEECKLQSRIHDRTSWFQYVLANDDRALCVVRLTKERLARLNDLKQKQEARQKKSEPFHVEAEIVPSRSDREYRIGSRENHGTGKWYFEVEIDHGKIREKLDATLFIGIEGGEGTFGTLYHIRPQDIVIKIGEGSITVVGGNLGKEIHLPKVTVGVAVDLDNGKLYHRRDGQWRVGVPGTAQGIDLKLGRVYKGRIIASVPLADLIKEGILSFNFGERPFSYSIPDGYALFDSKEPGGVSAPTQLGNVKVLPPGSLVEGHPPGYWVRKYFEWSRSFPQSAKPSADPTGVRCGAGQSGPVWFLTGSESNDPISRFCEVPANVYLFLSAVNVLAQPTKGKSVRCEELTESLRKYGSDVSGLYLKADGVELKNLSLYRAGTECFELDDVSRGLKGMAAGDGYWVFLEPLPPGNHDIEFGGKYLTDGFTQNIKYRITVK